jgi:hypothetical protein
MDITFYDKLISYFFDDLKLLNNTTGKYITTLKTFLNWSTERNYNSKIDYVKFKVKKEDADIVYLEYSELMQLYNMDLSDSPRMERVRDTFVLVVLQD